MVDYYGVLGVGRDASSQDIKVAFRKMALKFHPDRHAGASKAEQRKASDQFKRIKEAYEVLGNERQRANYNRSSAAGTSSHYGYGAGTSSSRTSSYTGYTSSSYTGYTSRDWQRSTSYNSSGSSSASSDGHRTDWQKASSYGGRRRNPPEYTVRWGSWTVSPADGPKMMLRATIFGLAVCTLMFMDSISSAAWHRRNAGKSYEEMLDRLEHEKRMRAREKLQNEAANHRNSEK